MVRLAEFLVVAPGDELTVGIRLRFARLYFVVLPIGTQRVVKLHGPVAPSQHAFRRPRPWVGMAENGSVFFQALIHPGDKTNVVVGLRVSRRVEHQAPGRVEVFLHAVHGPRAPLRPCRAGENGPGVALQMHLALRIRVRSDGTAVFCEAAQIPSAVPQLFFTHVRHAAPHGLVMLRVCLSAQPAGQCGKVSQCPNVQKAHHRAFAPAQVQAIVPVRPQALADPMRTHHALGKIQDRLQVAVNRVRPFIRIGHRHVKERGVPSLPHIVRHGGNKPQRIVAACVRQAVDHTAFIRRGHNGRALETLPGRLLEPFRLEQMQAVSLADKPF